jgi:cytochrome P450
MPVETAAEIYYDPFDPEIDKDPHPIWRRMRDESPLYWNEAHQFWALSRFSDVWAAYVDTSTFSSSHGVMLETLDSPTDFPSVIFMDPPEHDGMRKLVSRAFTPRRIADLEAHVTQLVSEYLDGLLGCTEFDYVEAFGALLPPMVIGHMLGVPEQDRDMTRRWFDQMLHREDGVGQPSTTAREAGLALFNYATALVAERRLRPGEDMLSVLLEAEIEETTGVRRLSETEIVHFVLLLSGAGSETVARLLSWAAVLLARFPDQRSRLLQDPALVPNAIEELLRFEAPSPVNGRWTLRPFEAYGVVVPPESKVLLLNGSANRDHREFSEPDRFDVTRSSKRHISFGYGPHFCLGAALARLEARVALSETLARFPSWEIEEDELVRVQTTTVRGFSSVPIHLDR